MQTGKLANIFINCPFDAQYLHMLHAMVFTVLLAGCIPRCTLEAADSSKQRMDRIAELIGICQSGIHDLSRTELDRAHQLPRFNMPFELGLFMGANLFANGPAKPCLILTVKPHDYDIYISDISGCDPKAHGNDIKTMIRRVRTWLNSGLATRRIDASTEQVYQLYRAFDADFRRAFGAEDQEYVRMSYDDYPEFTKNVTDWLRDNLRSRQSSRPDQ